MSGTLIEAIKNSEQRSELWQWDTGRQIKITLEENAIVDEVHFSNAYSKDALVVKPQVNEQGNIVADIPNILLWQVFPINIYVVMEFPNGKGTIYEEQLKINTRKKPSDYVYTETEILNYLDLEKRIKALEENGTGGITEETDPTVPQWAKEPTKPSYTADEVGAPAKEEFDKLSEDIADLKENGTGGGTSINAPKTGYYMHLSFDDVEKCINNLINKTYASIWEEPFFKWMKSLHDEYGAVFSLYLFNISSLSNVPNKFKNEFLKSSNWLKFGLHSNGTYANSTYLTGQSDWNTVINQILRFTGTHDAVDRVPRLNLFAGSLEALKGMRDAECGALGFLASDDTRKSYYLSDEQNEYLLTHDHLIDFENGLIFYQTDFRGDWFQSGFSPNYDYDAPTETNVYNELVRRLSVSKYADTFKSLIWFCHEQVVYDGSSLNTYKTWVEDACKFAFDYGISFDFPQNRIDINPTSYQFLNLSNGNGEVVVETTGISLDKEAITFTTNTTQTLIANVTPSNSTQPIKWESNDNNVATVGGGIVTPKGNGNCLITATSGSHSASCSVIVNLENIETPDVPETPDGFYAFGEFAPNPVNAVPDWSRMFEDNASLMAGDVVDFSDPSYYEKYTYALAKGINVTSGWIGGGYRQTSYTVVDTGSYTFTVKKLDETEFTEAEIAELNTVLGYWRT